MSDKLNIGPLIGSGGPRISEVDEFKIYTRAIGPRK